MSFFFFFFSLISHTLSSIMPGSSNNPSPAANARKASLAKCSPWNLSAKTTPSCAGPKRSQAFSRKKSGKTNNPLEISAAAARSPFVDTFADSLLRAGGLEGNNDSSLKVSTSVRGLDFMQTDEPLAPSFSLCFEQAWTDEKTLRQCATKVFWSTNLCGEKFLCLLSRSEGCLYCIPYMLKVGHL